MLTNAITLLQERLDSISDHLDVLKRIETISKIIPQENEDIKYIQSQQTKEKIFNYRANIISLYGALEFFVEEVFKEYIVHLKSIIPQYDSLNYKIKEGYFINVTKLHSKLHYAKFSHITERQIAQNIERVIVQNKNEIIPESFLGNGGNYKHNVICTLMNSIGISNIDSNIIQIDPMLSVLSELTFDKEQQRKMIQIRIDELVDRRNEIAHGVTTDEIIDIERFENILDFIKAYCNSLNKLLEQELLEYKWNQLSSNSYSSIRIHGKSIVELRIKNIQLSIGNKILIKKQKFPFYVEANVMDLRIKDNENGNILEKQDICINDLEHLISIKVSAYLKNKCELKFI